MQIFASERREKILAETWKMFLTEIFTKKTETAAEQENCLLIFVHCDTKKLQNNHLK